MSSQICNNSRNPDRNLPDKPDSTNQPSSTKELTDIYYVIGRTNISFDDWVSEIKPSELRYIQTYIHTHTHTHIHTFIIKYYLFRI